MHSECRFVYHLGFPMLNLHPKCSEHEIHLLTGLKLTSCHILVVEASRTSSQREFFEMILTTMIDVSVHQSILST